MVQKLEETETPRSESVVGVANGEVYLLLSWLRVWQHHTLLYRVHGNWSPSQKKF